MATKTKKIKDLAGGKNAAGEDILPFPPIYDEYDFFYSIIYNAIELEDADYFNSEIFKRQIIESNYIGYDSISERFRPAKPIKADRYRPPEKAMIYFDGAQVWRELTVGYEPESPFYLIKGLSGATTLSEIIRTTTDTFIECDISIFQNIRALRNGLLVKCRTPEERLSLLQAIQQQQCGAPAIVADESIIAALQSVDLRVTVVFDKIYEYRQQRRNDLFNMLGTMSANVNKRERVQVGEVNATVGQCEDSIYALIDNVNKQFESFALPYKLKLNNSLEELYTNFLN